MEMSEQFQGAQNHKQSPFFPHSVVQSSQNAFDLTLERGKGLQHRKEIGWKPQNDTLVMMKHKPLTIAEGGL